MIKKIQEFDKKTSFSMLKYHKYKWLNKLMIFISSCGDKGMSWLFVIALTYYNPETRFMSIYIVLSLLFATLAGQITIKSIVRRKRPCHTYTDVEMLIPVPSDLSFPSGHTTSSFACSTTLFVFNPILGLIGYIYASLTAISRVYLFVHYVSDVLSGVLLGSFVGFIVTVLF